MKENDKVYQENKQITNELMNDYFEKLETNFELYNIDKQQIAYKSYDGFIAFTNGGFEITGYTNLQFIKSTGNYPENVKVIFEKIIDDNLTEITEDEDEYEILTEMEVQFQLGIYFYDKDNLHNGFNDVASIYVFGEINWESPYFRSNKNCDIRFDKEFIIDDNFEKNLKEALENIVNEML